MAGTPEWERAGVLKANPDLAQLPVRAAALSQGKVVYVAVPRLAADLPFLSLDSDRLTGPPRKAASIRGAASEGVPVGFDAMGPIDLIVCGSVAVNRKGVRIGKGGGYSDLEFALGRQAGVIGDWTTIATTVHALQVLDEDLPETPHDFRLDLIVTPDEVIRVGPRQGLQGPPGILWDELDKTKIAAIPELVRREKLRPDRGISAHPHD